jgi:hypothetical protein
MHIKTFAAEIAGSNDLDIAVLYETLAATRIASVHMKQTWTTLADMVDATRNEMLKRGLRLPTLDHADSAYDAAFNRAVMRRNTNAHRLEAA